MMMVHLVNNTLLDHFQDTEFLPSVVSVFTHPGGVGAVTQK
jgi:hypothetical protein